MSLRLVLCVCAALLLVGVAVADVPQLINYQGILKSGGTPVTTPTMVIFAVWNDPTGGDSLWSELQTVTPDGNGLFNVLLGSVSPIPDSAFTGSNMYLSLQVEADPEMTPRQRLTSVAYAYRDKDWALIDDILFTGDDWGIARAGNVLYDIYKTTHINLGEACTTGQVDYPRKNCTIGGGKGNHAELDFCTIGGGNGNCVSGLNSTIGGGLHNLIEGGSAVISGGQHNVASDLAATVAGGANNRARGLYSVIAGGGGVYEADSNSALGYCSSILGGRGNIANGDSSCIGGGTRNTTGGINSTISGGYTNTAGLDYATVGGGSGNAANGAGSTIGGGADNSAGQDGSTVGGGQENAASDYYSTVGGGRYNTAGETYSVVGGGASNVADGGSATIGGGNGNHASGRYSQIGGGGSNTAAGDSSCIGGGTRNTASGTSSAVGGGFNNTALGHASTVAGGESNVAGIETQWRYATVGGGYSNSATGQYATVAGGDENSAVDFGATVPGGYQNRAGSAYSFAAGTRAKANHYCSFVWNDDPGADFASTSTNQFLIHATGGVGINTNNPQAKLHVANGGIRIETVSTPLTFVESDQTGAGSLWRQCLDSKKIFFDASNNGTDFSSYTRTIVLTSTGEVGIGTTTPPVELSVVGSICYTGSIGACSDARYKKDIETVPHALDKISKLRGVNFDWKTDEYPDHKFTDNRQLGFIAQELQEIIPEVVMEDADGYLSVDYGRLTPVLVEAIKDLKAENDVMKAENVEIKAQLTEMQALLSQLMAGNTSNHK